jgi:hypothetical protein
VPSQGRRAYAGGPGHVEPARSHGRLDAQTDYTDQPLVGADDRVATGPAVMREGAVLFPGPIGYTTHDDARFTIEIALDEPEIGRSPLRGPILSKLASDEATSILEAVAQSPQAPTSPTRWNWRAPGSARRPFGVP